VLRNVGKKFDENREPFAHLPLDKTGMKKPVACQPVTMSVGLYSGRLGHKGNA